MDFEQKYQKDPGMNRVNILIILRGLKASQPNARPPGGPRQHLQHRCCHPGGKPTTGQMCLLHRNCQNNQSSLLLMTEMI